MDKKRVLYVSQEIFPYTNETKMGVMGSSLPQITQESGKDIRIFLPRFGTVNERRHQLHEVIRLSGMNLIIDDFDHQLIIKVASIQQLRMQVYFIDNEEFFPRRQLFHDSDGVLLSNNDERMIFYCKGVIETVRKLGWSPDVIHCQGWFTSLVPMYIKKLYADDPLFENTKVIYSVFDNGYEGKLSESIIDKLLFEDLKMEDVEGLANLNVNQLNKFAASYADGVIQASDNIDKDVIDHIKSLDKPFMEFPGEEDYKEAYLDFYEIFIPENEEIEA
ncbi:MAG: glycogen/starch synthase [Flavobacteriales bacterium]|jgi:starch synthase|nr:glycogen/starch synthase [Flavobacteriales bacterium]|tara:strand:+ start:2124 stop:2951 length:828 start_codon:yes stop_codon:yes gene_type:complete